jgi:hypothetical protein
VEEVPLGWATELEGSLIKEEQKKNRLARLRGPSVHYHLALIDLGLRAFPKPYLKEEASSLGGRAYFQDPSSSALQLGS